MEKHSRVYAEIDLDAIRYNMEQMKQRVGADAQFIAVVKTDGYGHGAIPIAQMLEKDPSVWGYATATLEEAVAAARTLQAGGMPPSAAAKQAAAGTPFSKGQIYKELIK